MYLVLFLPCSKEVLLFMNWKITSELAKCIIPPYGALNSTLGDLAGGGIGGLGRGFFAG